MSDAQPDVLEEDTTTTASGMGDSSADPCASICAKPDDGFDTVALAWPLLPEAIKAAVIGIVRPYLPAKYLLILHGRDENGELYATLTDRPASEVEADPKRTDVANDVPHCSLIDD